MGGGCDKGFCLVYWSLSYRRKFIRTLWTFAFALLAAAALFAKRPVIRTMPAFTVATVLVLMFLAQTFYNYRRWQAEERSRPPV